MGAVKEGLLQIRGVEFFVLFDKGGKVIESSHPLSPQKERLKEGVTLAFHLVERAGVRAKVIQFVYEDHLLLAMADGGLYLMVEGERRMDAPLVRMTMNATITEMGKEKRKKGRGEEEYTEKELLEKFPQLIKFWEKI